MTSMQETYIAERKARVERRRKILRDVIDAGLPGFAIEHGGEHEDKGFVIFNRHVRISAWFNTDRNDVERIAFSGIWPRDKDGRAAYCRHTDGPGPEATVSASRPARQIANVIANKVYMRVAEISNDIRARIAKREQVTGAHKRFAAEFSRRFSEGQEPYLQAGEYLLRAGGFRAGVSQDGRVRLHLEGLTFDEVEAAITAIAQHRKGTQQ